MASITSLTTFMISFVTVKRGGPPQKVSILIKLIERAELSIHLNVRALKTVVAHVSPDVIVFFWKEQLFLSKVLGPKFPPKI